MIWRRAIEGDTRFALEDEVQRPNPQPSNAEHAVGRFLSTSFVASLAAPRQQELVAEIRTLVAELGPQFDFPYRTEAQIWRRSSA